MQFIRLLFAIALSLGMAAAQGPQTTPRGAVNGVSFGSAPANVARGGILAVLGSGLAAAHSMPEGTPLPVALEDPVVEVLVNGVAAPLFFVSPTQINLQIPWETEAGRAEVVVRRDGADSAAMPVNVVDASPNLFTHAGTSSLIAQAAIRVPDPVGGPASETAPLALDRPDTSANVDAQVLDPAAEITPGQGVTVFGAGLGETTPAAVTGAVAPEGGAELVASQRAYLGGIPVTGVSAKHSSQLVGVYELTFDVPQLTEAGEILRWYSGNAGGAGLLGAPGPVEARFMAVPEGSGEIGRIDLSDLNPYYIAATGPQDELDFCYKGAHLLDFRREKVTSISNCILPSFPLAANEVEYRPFEVSNHTPVIVAIEASDGFQEPGLTNRMLVIDTAADTVTQVVLPTGVDRLRSGFGPNPNMMLLQGGTASSQIQVDTAGTVIDQFDIAAPLPNPLVEGMSRAVAQPGGTNFTGGYRMRFLGPDGGQDNSGTHAVLFNREAAVVASVPFPAGWAPVQPPRNINPQGNQVGNAYSPVTGGFGGDTVSYLVARSTAGTEDAVVSFRASLPEDPEAPLPAAIEVEAKVMPFPQGSFVANCHPQVRWQRIGLTESIAIAGSGQALSEFANPRENQLCVADRLLLLDTQTDQVKVVQSPAPLEVGQRGAVQSYLYFADGGREVPLEAPAKIQVFDPVQETFREIVLPEDVGVTLNLQPQPIPQQARLVVLATGGPTRTNARGFELPPLPGNRGLLVVDLAEAKATHLPLPEGFQRVLVLPGNSPLNQQGRRTFGVFPLLGRPFARATRPGPNGSAILTWDIESAEVTEIALPEGAHWVLQTTGGGNQVVQAGPLWDYKPQSNTIAFGVFDRDRNLISIGVVGPQ